MKPIAVFHIRPEKRSRLSLRVEVYEDHKAFMRAVRVLDREDGKEIRVPRGQRLMARCLGVTVRNRKGRLGNLFSVVQFPKEHLTMSTITHEAFHATMRWAERRGIPAIPTNQSTPDIVKNRSGIEERCACVHDELCRRIVVVAQERRLFPEDRVGSH